MKVLYLLSSPFVACDGDGTSFWKIAASCRIRYASLARSLRSDRSSSAASSLTLPAPNSDPIPPATAAAAVEICPRNLRRLLA